METDFLSGFTFYQCQHMTYVFMSPLFIHLFIYLMLFVLSLLVAVLDFFFKQTKTMILLFCTFPLVYICFFSYG